MLPSGIIASVMKVHSDWAHTATAALVEKAKEVAGSIERFHYSVTEVARPGTENLDRIEVKLTIKAP